MASGKKIAYETSTLELLLGISPSANRWVALFTVAPTVSTAGTEISDAGYARQPATFAAVSGSNPAQSSNSADLDFGAAQGGSITVVAFAVMDAVSAGNQIYYGDLTNFTIPIGIGIHVESGVCVVTEK